MGRIQDNKLRTFLVVCLMSVILKLHKPHTGFYASGFQIAHYSVLSWRSVPLRSRPSSHQYSRISMKVRLAADISNSPVPVQSPVPTIQKHYFMSPVEDISANDAIVRQSADLADTTNDDRLEIMSGTAQFIATDRIVNALILACAFGYAIHTILDVNHGMTRGWTQKEIVLRMPYDNWRNYENSLASSPIWTKTTINVIIYLLGDWLSQTVFNKKNLLDFDAARTFKNGFIGMCFGPLVAEYYEFSDWILPVEVGMNRLYKIVMDQTVYLGIKCSIYIAAVTILNGEGFQKANENVRTRIKPVMFTAWKFWPFVHCITYGFIPAQHRILWVNSVDLVWNAILAALSRGDTDKREESNKNVSICDIDGVENVSQLGPH